MPASRDSGYRLAGMWLLHEITLFASDNGEGIVGETDDKIITFFSLGVVVFFALVAVIGTVIQSRLEKRKEERKAVELRKRVGW